MGGEDDVKTRPSGRDEERLTKTQEPQIVQANGRTRRERNASAKAKGEHNRREIERNRSEEDVECARRKRWMRWETL